MDIDSNFQLFPSNALGHFSVASVFHDSRFLTVRSWHMTSKSDTVQNLKQTQSGSNERGQQFRKDFCLLLAAT